MLVRGSGIELPAPKNRVRPDATSSWVTPTSVARKRLRFIPVMRRTWLYPRPSVAPPARVFEVTRSLERNVTAASDSSVRSVATQIPPGDEYRAPTRSPESPNACRSGAASPGRMNSSPDPEVPRYHPILSGDGAAQVKVVARPRASRRARTEFERRDGLASMACCTVDGRSGRAGALDGVETGDPLVTRNHPALVLMRRPPAGSASSMAIERTLPDTVPPDHSWSSGCRLSQLFAVTIQSDWSMGSTCASSTRSSGVLPGGLNGPSHRCSSGRLISTPVLPTT